MINDADWLKSGVSAVVGGVSAAIGLLWRQNSRIQKVETGLASKPDADRMTKVETAVGEIPTAVAKTIENGERLARLEGKFDAQSEQLTRIENKLS